MCLGVSELQQGGEGERMNDENHAFIIQNYSGIVAHTSKWITLSQDPWMSLRVCLSQLSVRDMTLKFPFRVGGFMCLPGHISHLSPSLSQP